MNSTSATAIILSSLTQYGSAILFILGAVIGLSLGYLIFVYGWSSIKKSTNSGNSGNYIDDMGTAWPTKKQRDWSNKEIVRQGL